MYQTTYLSQFLGLLFPLLCLGILIYLVFSIFTVSKKVLPIREEPTVLLKRRLANGEITTAEFEKLRKLL